MNQGEMLHEYNKLRERFGDIHELRFVKGQWVDTIPDASAQMIVIVSLGSWDGQEDERDASIFYYTDGDLLKRGDTICDGDFIITDIWNQKGNRVHTLRSSR